MAKVIRSFSLDLETVELLERYCGQSDNWDKRISRSKTVNDAIKWFISGDTAELVHNNELLIERVRKANMELMEPAPRDPPWWRRLLLGR